MDSSPAIDSRARVGATAAMPRRLVTDAPTRMFHWLFALSFVGAYVTAESEHWRLVHVTLGYSFAGLLGFRVLYGLVGPRHARLAPMWRKLRAGPAWLRSLSATRPPASVNWRQGQNLAMALAIVLMMALVVPFTLSGHAAYEHWGDALGGEWVAETHEFFADVFMIVVLAHLGLIVLLSVLRRQNQALPMLIGRVPGSGPSPVRRDRSWLAALLLTAVLAFGAWQWVSAPRAPMLDRPAHQPRPPSAQRFELRSLCGIGAFGGLRLPGCA